MVRYAAAQGRTRFAALAPERRLWGTRARPPGGRPWRRCPARTAAVAETFPPDSDSPKAAVSRWQPSAGRAACRPSRPTDPASRCSRRRSLPLTLPPPGFDALLIADGGQRVSVDRGPARLLRHRARERAAARHDALAGRSGAACRRRPAGCLARDLAARRDRRVQRRFARCLWPEPGAAGGARLRRDRVGGAAGAAGSRASPRPSSPIRKALSEPPGSSGCGPTGSRTTVSPWSRSRRARSGCWTRRRARSTPDWPAAEPASRLCPFTVQQRALKQPLVYNRLRV